ncbi:MAG: response regulator [Candidatus Omnitrophica bacterium]|nr:response regulator [Candidatus Omnitrophota bacterium]
MKKILIVDDEESFGDIVKLNLEYTGLYRVCAEKEGLRAVESALREKPDLIILDMLMPDTDGVAILEALRAEPSLKKTSVVFLTAFMSDRDLQALRVKIGVNVPILSKPISSEKLLEAIGRYAR